MGVYAFVCMCVFIYAVQLLAQYTLSALDYTASLHGLAGGLAYLYYAYTPRVNTQIVQIGGLVFSDKALVYFWAVYLAGSGARDSLVSSMLGWLAALLYMRVLHPLVSRLAMPRWMDAALDWTGDFYPRMVVPNITRAAPGVQQRQAAVQRPTAPRVVPPDPEAVDHLVNMGFDRPRVLQALQAADNNLHRAADLLLMGAM
jgi:UBA/TS-N domain